MLKNRPFRRVFLGYSTEQDFSPPWRIEKTESITPVSSL